MKTAMIWFALYVPGSFYLSTELIPTTVLQDKYYGPIWYMRTLGLREAKGIRDQNKDSNPGTYLSTTLLSPTSMEVSSYLL